MKAISLIIILFFGVYSVENEPDLPKFAIKKMNKSLEAIWPEKDITKFEVKSDEFNYLYKLISPKGNLGYLLIHQAPSRDMKFDYMIIYNRELKIVGAEILIYREDYGGEIGSKRWLSQFKGQTANSPMRLNEDIIGISGATISCRSATHAFKSSTKKLVELKQKGLI